LLAFFPQGRSGPTSYLYSPSRVGSLRPHVAVVHTVTGHELPRVHVVTVPRLLASVERTRVGVALRLEVEDGVDCAGRATVTDSDHNRVLVRTHDIGDA
jgi:hypothetical protein